MHIAGVIMWRTSVGFFLLHFILVSIYLTFLQVGLRCDILHAGEFWDPSRNEEFILFSCHFFSCS